jgi:hypothetical protein
MNGSTISEVTIAMDQGKEHVRRRNPDTVREGVSFNELLQPLITVRSYGGDAGI